MAPGSRHLLLLAGSGAVLGITQDRPALDLVVLAALVPLAAFVRGRLTAGRLLAGSVAFAVPYYAAALRWYFHLHDNLGLASVLALYVLSILSLSAMLLAAMALANRLPRRLPFPIIFTAAWLIMEWAQQQPPFRMYFMTLAMRLASGPGLPFAQVAALGGPAAASAYVLAVNLLLLRLLGRPRGLALAGLILLLAAAPALHHLRARSAAARPAHLTAALVSTAIDSDLPRWSKTARIEELCRLTGEIDAPPDLIVMPENAIPFMMDQRAERRDYFAGAGPAGAPILAGAHSMGWEGQTLKLQNSAFLLAGDGAIRDRYDKACLAPIYESRVLWGLIPSLNRLSAGMTPAGDPEPIALGAHSLGTLICWESAIPGLARRLRQAGSGVLVNLSDDVAVKEAVAPYLRGLRLRAIETGLWACRASNFGGSEVVDPLGGRRGGLDPGTAGVAMAELGPPLDPTPYVRLGDWPTAAAAVALLGLAAWGLRSRRGGR